MTLSFLAFAALMAWISLVFFRGGFWRADQRLGDASAPAAWPEIVVVIPARDEAETIGGVVTAHLNSRYQGELSVILADDGSADGTAEKARSAADEKDRRLDIIDVSKLPEGWSGKLWAVHNGLNRAAEIAPNAKYILLTDADILLAPDTLARLVAKAEHEHLALASLMARLDSRGQWGALLIPAFIYFFQKLYPFSRANDPTDNLAAAAGGCMLVRAQSLYESGGVEAIKGELIDDCALARNIKDITPATKIWLGLADDEAVSMRDNRALPSIWNMVARTAYAQLNYSPLMLAGTIAGMALVYLVAPIAVLFFIWHGTWSAFYYGAIAWGLMAYSYWPTLKLYGRPPWETAALPVAAAFYTAMTFTSAWRHWNGQGGQWKGRTY